MAPLRAVRLAVTDLWADLWMALVCNVLWLLGMVLVIPGAPATFALFAYANRLANGERADLGDFWAGFRQHWKTAYAWGLLNICVVVFLVSDNWLVALSLPADLARYFQVFYWAVLVAWIIVQFYTLPFFFELERPRLVTALRNGALMLGKNLGFSLGFAVFLLLALALGSLLFLLSLAFGGMLIALASSHAVIERLGAERKAA